MKFVIEVKNECHEEWLKQMIEREVEDTKDTIADEELFEKGSDGDAALGHRINAMILKEWKDILTYALKKALKGDTNEI